MLSRFVDGHFHFFPFTPEEQTSRALRRVAYASSIKAEGPRNGAEGAKGKRWCTNNTFKLAKANTSSLECSSQRRFFFRPAPRGTKRDTMSATTARNANTIAAAVAPPNVALSPRVALAGPSPLLRRGSGEASRRKPLASHQPSFLLRACLVPTCFVPTPGLK